MQQQRSFDFDPPPVPEMGGLAEATSLPPPQQTDARNASLPSPPLARPDRQLTYGGASHDEWPPPFDDRDTITVDRIRADIDGPPHRFVIKCGDIVEVFFDSQACFTTEVIGIRPVSPEVQIHLPGFSVTPWIEKELIFPASEISSKEYWKTQRHPDLQAIQGSTGPIAQVFSPPATSASLNSDYSREHFCEFLSKRDNLNLTFTEYREHFERLVAAKESLLADFQLWTKKELCEFAGKLGVLDSRHKKKADVAQVLYREMLTSFVWDGTVSYTMDMSLEEAIIAKVRSATPQALEDAQQSLKNDLAKYAKALLNPETFYEYRTFLREKS